MLQLNRPLALCLLTSLVACCHADHDSHSGSVTIGGGGGPAHEVEPNDDAFNANYLGAIAPGEFIQIQGHITECCHDEYDGFAFYALGPVSVRITLHESNPFADLDFAVYIPEINDFVAAWETDNHPEFGIFDFVGPGEFHIVINSWIGDSSYLLDVDVQPLFPATPSPDGGPESLAETAAPEAEADAPSNQTLERFGAYGRPARSRDSQASVEARVYEPEPAPHTPEGVDSQH
jgi:hypothetical protein